MMKRKKKVNYGKVIKKKVIKIKLGLSRIKNKLVISFRHTPINDSLKQAKKEIKFNKSDLEYIDIKIKHTERTLSFLNSLRNFIITENERLDSYIEEIGENADEECKEIIKQKEKKKNE